MEAGVRILFTPAAKAVQRAPTFQLPPDLRQLLFQLQVGDIVDTPPCTEAFVVTSRQWTIKEDLVELAVILDLLQEREPLSLVK